MRGNWSQRIRKFHTWLGVFFSPLLLLFVATGWWQTFVLDDDRDKGAFNVTMGQIANIHTDSSFFQKAGAHHPSEIFKWLVGAMAVSLILTILLGLTLACRTVKQLWLTLAIFSLGILVPLLALYFG